MEARTIHTEAGDLRLIPVEPGEVRAIARYWRPGLVSSDQLPAEYGLVFQRGGSEVHGVKLQPPDIPESDAMAVHHMNRMLIAGALPHYLEKGHRGLMLPCAYYKEKPNNLVESGIMFFTMPDEATARPMEDPKQEVFDRTLGRGASMMIFDMIEGLARSSREHKLFLQPVIGVDLRPRLAVGGIVMHFAIVGSTVIVIKDQLDEREPVWKVVVKAGFSVMPYTSVCPIALPDPPGPEREQF